VRSAGLFVLISTKGLGGQKKGVYTKPRLANNFLRTAAIVQPFPAKIQRHCSPVTGKHRFALQQECFRRSFLSVSRSVSWLARDFRFRARKRRKLRGRPASSAGLRTEDQHLSGARHRVRGGHDCGAIMGTANLNRADGRGSHSYVGKPAHAQQ